MAAAFRASDLVRRSTLAFAVISCVLQVVLASILANLAATTLKPTAVLGTALSATVLDFLVFAVLLITAILSLRSHSTVWPRALIFFLSAASFLLFLISSVLSIYALGWTQAQISSKQLGDESSGLVIAGLVFGSINIMIQTAFHVLHSMRHREKDRSAKEPVAERQSSPRSMKRSLSIHLKSMSPGSRADSVMASPGLSPYLDASPSARSSFRYSLNQVIRPITSKTKLLLAQCQTPSLRESQSFVSKRDNSLEISCRGDGFENWDTSAVENQFVSPFVSKPKPAKKLEPIPGSRPVSPAKALNGPFPLITSPEDVPLPELSLNSPVSPGSDSGSVCGIPFPPLRRDSNASDQAHIHPLFRTHSPTPPPTPSPGTVVTASPYAGQVVSPDHGMVPRRLHSAAGSRPCTPTGSRAGSFKSVRRPSGLSTNKPMEVDDDDVPEVPKI